ncbi:MAG TPA: tetratricopeptide repeat protein [Bryobacteraceae bacterium]|nr:tetratricopeptide repeat protein [Bryobacteraceae bacterium]
MRVVCAVAFAVVLHAQAGSYEEAVALVRAGEFAQAIPTIEKLVQANPNDLKARNLLGIALSGAGRRTEANQQFERVLQGNPRFLPALKNLAHNQLELGQVELAERNFRSALKAAPGDASVQFGLGRLGFLRKDYPSAVVHFEKSNGLHLQDPLAIVEYAGSCIELGATDKARVALASLPNAAPAGIQFQAGVLLARMSEYASGAVRFELARAAGFDGYKSGFNLGLALLKSGNAVAAIRVAEETLREAAATSELYSLLAQAYEKASRTKDAYEALRTAIRLNSTDESPYVELIALCLDHENQELGLEIANLGVKAIPTSARLRLQRGVIHALASRSDDALTDFRTAVRLRPDAPLGYVAEALTLLRMDRNAEAAAMLRKRAKLKPDDHLANWMLAEALVKIGPAAEREAIAALERSIETEPKMPQSRLLLGKLLLATGEVERALVQLETATQLDQANTGGAYLLAQAYRKAGRTEDANRLFARVSAAKAEDPSGASAKALLRIVRDNMATSSKQ